MSKCMCESLFESCEGKVKRYKVYSDYNDIVYPGRFWGVMDYCDKHKQEDQANGYAFENMEAEAKVCVL